MVHSPSCPGKADLRSVEADRIQNSELWGMIYGFIKQDTLTTVGQYLVTKHGNVSAAEAYVISF